jgi:hypothetical protein
MADAQWLVSGGGGRFNVRLAKNGGSCRRADSAFLPQAREGIQTGLYGRRDGILSGWVGISSRMYRGVRLRRAATGGFC